MFIFRLIFLVLFIILSTIKKEKFCKSCSSNQKYIIQVILFFGILFPYYTLAIAGTLALINSMINMVKKNKEDK